MGLGEGTFGTSQSPTLTRPDFQKYTLHFLSRKVDSPTFTLAFYTRISALFTCICSNKGIDFPTSFTQRLIRMVIGTTYRYFEGIPQKNALLYPLASKTGQYLNLISSCKLTMNIGHSLISLCREGDRKAQYQLYKECFPLLMGVCNRYHQNKDDAMASLNQGFLKIVTKLDTYKEDIPFVAWARRIMINTIIDDFRKHKKYHELHHMTSFEDEYDHINWTAHNDAELSLDADAILHLIRELPPMTREVFNLYAIDGYTHKEIGEKLNIAPGTSKWHVSAARKELQPKIVQMLAQEKRSL